MRVLLLSYEYPPAVHGGLGVHVDAVSAQLASLGHAVHVVTRGHPGAAADDVRNEVVVHRVPDPPPVVPDDDWLARVLTASLGIQGQALDLVRREPFDVIHAHDWLVAYPAATVKSATALPLVATLHATEHGRHQGWLPGAVNRYIHQVEWWLTHEARRVITCSRYQHDQAQRIFDLPPSKLDVIPNGVSVDEFGLVDARAVAATRAHYLRAPGQRLLLYVGRLEYEKGVDTLLRAVRRLRRRGEALQLVIAGDGTHRQALEDQARALRIRRSVTFTGHVQRRDVGRLHRAADVTVVPSLYEPFGIVALEAMAAGTPLVVADTGGLSEIVEDGRTGLRFPPRDVTALTTALTRLLDDRRLARRLAGRAREQVTTSGSWEPIAARTVAVYERAVAEERQLSAAQPTHAAVGATSLPRPGVRPAGP